MSEQIKNGDIEITTTQKNNDLIINLKLKLDRANYILSNLLDINNLPHTQKILKDKNITLMNQTEFGMVQKAALDLIDELTIVAERINNEINPKEVKNG